MIPESSKEDGFRGLGQSQKWYSGNILIFSPKDVKQEQGAEMVYGNLPPQAICLWKTEKGLDERSEQGLWRRKSRRWASEGCSMGDEKYSKGHVGYKPGGAYFAMKSRKGKLTQCYISPHVSSVPFPPQVNLRNSSEFLKGNSKDSRLPRIIKIKYVWGHHSDEVGPDTMIKEQRGHVLNSWADVQFQQVQEKPNYLLNFILLLISWPRTMTFTEEK